MTSVTLQWRDATRAIRDINLALKRQEDLRRVIHAHMGADHPDAETYSESKMGVIYAMEGDAWAFNKGLNDLELGGPEMRAPTCQICHMYNNTTGKWGHNVTSKGRWRNGNIPACPGRV